MGKIRETLQEQKCEMLFRYYIYIIENNKEMAGKVTRGSLCADAAEPFFNSGPSAQVIINEFVSGRRKVIGIVSDEEFEEFMVLFGKWYSQDKLTAGFIGIRADESLHRYRAITATKKNLTFNNWKWTTKMTKSLYNVYPIYDWRTEDIWIFHVKNKHLTHNKVYDLMTRAGVKFSNQRLCQPFGDDQKKGLWLYHLLDQPGTI